jgi:hypothetical protein
VLLVLFVDTRRVYETECNSSGSGGEASVDGSSEYLLMLGNG